MGCLGSRKGKVSGLVEPEARGAERSYEYRKKFGGTLLSAAPLGLMCQRLLLPPGHTDRDNPTLSLQLPRDPEALQGNEKAEDAVLVWYIISEGRLL